MSVYEPQRTMETVATFDDSFSKFFVQLRTWTPSGSDNR